MWLFRASKDQWKVRHRLRLSLFRFGGFGELGIDLSGFERMDVVVVNVGLGQLALAPEASNHSRRLSSKTLSILMASIGQTSTPILQVMQIEMSMSRTRGSICFAP